MEILCFFAGIAFFYTKSLYPLCLIGVFLLFKRWTLVFSWVLSAILWCCIHQILIAEKAMPAAKSIPKAILQGYVASIPTHTATKTQFQFFVTSLNNRSVNTRILMSCYNTCPDFHAGDYWRVSAKVQRPKNLNNPGGFDYVTWLNARHIHWTGYVRNHHAQLLGTCFFRYPFLIIRERMASVLSKGDFDPISQGVLEALTLGITTHIDKSSWDLFRRTGTTHLMVISGAHIGLVAGLIYGLVQWIWCWFPRLCLLMPARKMASIIAFLTAALYSILAGFAAPTQRALIVCFFMFLHNFISQRFSIWQAWRYALLVVLFLEPHSVIMPGFYLSFIAVAILAAMNQKIPYKGFKKTVLMQIACLVGLMPLTLFWFSYGAVNGFFANLIAIPWVSFIVVPLGLLTTLLGSWFLLPWSVTILSKSIHFLFYYLHWIDSFSMLNVNISFTQLLLPLAFIISLSLFIFMPLPRLIPVALIIFIAGCLPEHEKIKLGEARMDVLDVGQGLAIVIRTANHILVYDTGVKFYQGSDMGQRVIIPYLQTLGVKNIDKVIISHPDLDHLGGLRSLEETYKIKQLIVDNPSVYKRGLSCHQYPDWTWDGISFHFFANPSAIKTKNNSSCVLQILNGKNRILLTGDIEKQAEEYLIKTYGHRLSSQVLVIPHHGSKTSSSDQFLDNVAPQYAIASYGFDNRYHFPHATVMQRYRQHHIMVYNTSDYGMLSVFLKSLRVRGFL